MDDITSLSLTRLAELVKARKVSPVEVAEAHLNRISEINPRLNAVVTLASDAIEKAKQAEAAVMRGELCGPLHGLPVTIKDTIETAGIRSTSGSMMRVNFVPDRDAIAVQRLKAAGAIVLGKTNPAEMAMDYTSDNPVFGRTNNPYDKSKGPGGSSGGEAVAITTCMSPAGLGSDLAGSVRIPAHFCGIAALKPTVGRVPGAGQFPAATGPYKLGSVIGPMARTVADLQLMLAALSNEVSGSVEGRSALRGLHAAFYTDDGVSPVTGETIAAVKDAAAALSEAGMILEDVRPPGVERGNDIWLKLFSRASVVQLRNVYAGNEEKGGDFVRWRLGTADEIQPPTLDEYIQSWIERDQMRQRLIDWMAHKPLLFCPVGATPAFEHGAIKISVEGQTLSTFRAFSYCQTFNAFDLPVAVVRAGYSNEGLPIGVQIVGRPFEEELVLAAAAVVETATGGWQAPPN